MREKEMRMTMLLRKVIGEDAKILFDWTNDPETRKNSFSSEPVSWENHVRWLTGKLAEKNCYFYIGENEQGMPVGTIRFDYQEENNTAVVSYSVAPVWRGKGFGTQLLTLGETEMVKEKGNLTLRGEVKAGNTASRNCFLKNGYREQSATEEEVVFAKKAQ